MRLPEIVDVVRNFSVMIRVQGPDPKGLKMRKHAFHHYNYGKTTLSASGMLLPSSFYATPSAKQVSSDNNKHPLPSSLLVLTVASVIEPFVSLKHRGQITQVKPELIPGVQIDIMVEGKSTVDCDAKVPGNETLHWLPAELLTLVDIPVSSVALQSLIEASSGSSEHGWEIGWSLASYNDGPEPFVDGTQTEVQRSAVQSLGQGVVAESSNPSLVAKSATRIAVLGVSSTIFEDLPNLNISPPNKRGDLLLAMGAPFGILSPVHFCNSISVGSVANCYPPGSFHRSLLMADIRCLPGMEGSAVFGERAELIGILTRPLRQRGSGAEIQLVIPWEAIATAFSDLLPQEPQDAWEGIRSNNRKVNPAGKKSLPNNLDLIGSFNHVNEHSNSRGSPSPVEKAMASICLITIDDGVWASGVLLNNRGLILTNAHLLEPWRFRKAAASEDNENKSDLLFAPSNDTVFLRQGSLPTKLRTADFSLGDEHGNRFNLNKIIRRSIRVRLDHMDPWIWCDASVLYVSKGPLDIALLQLEFVPDKLYPIIMDFTCPSPGSKAYVIGHGLFGPRCDFLPSACVGVVAKVVKAKRLVAHQTGKEENEQRDFPAMIETTAAVHPGGSGGAVVNSDGHMIGIVTSNARHGGGTVIPHLNFSIPCAALEPIFKFSKDMQELSLLEDLDKPNEHLSSVWALIPPLSPKPAPSLHSLPPILPGDKKNDTKGARFAKFIAERHELLKNTSQLGRVDGISTNFLPSKL